MTITWDHICMTTNQSTKTAAVTYAYAIIATMNGGAVHSLTTGMANYADACVIANNVSKMPDVKGVNIAVYEHPRYQDREAVRSFVNGRPYSPEHVRTLALSI